MEITKLQERVEGFKKQKEVLFAQLNQLEGAIADSQYWINELSPKPVEETNGAVEGKVVEATISEKQRKPKKTAE